MIKVLKIRFIEFNNLFYIQKKTLFGWEYIKYECQINSEPKQIRYYSENKKDLLNTVIKDYYGLGTDLVTIIEFPTIKKYKI